MPAKPITFPYPTGKSCTVNIDFQGHEYLLHWEGDWRELPSLTRFPLVDNASVTRIPHSARVHELWTRSQVLKYGADSHLRQLDSCTDEFPICKVAIDDRQRCLLREEFSILQHLSSHGCPVVRTHREPLVDDQGMFGFRMERLADIDLDTGAEYRLEIQRAIEDIHRHHVVHHDISPSNIMLNQQGCITIIDFGRAGYLGEKIPPYKATGTRPTENHHFSFDSDDNALKSTIDIFNRKGCFSFRS